MNDAFIICTTRKAIFLKFKQRAEKSIGIPCKIALIHF